MPASAGGTLLRTDVTWVTHEPGRIAPRQSTYRPVRHDLSRGTRPVPPHLSDRRRTSVVVPPRHPPRWRRSRARP